MASAPYSTPYAYQGYYAAQAQPITMPQKQNNPYYPQYQYQYPQAAYSHMSASPPEAGDSVTTSGVPSYDPSAAGSSYAASASDYETSSSGATSVDLLEYMNERMHSSFNPMPLDRSLAQQAQTSGQLNDKTRQLMELQALAQQQFAAMQAQFSEGIKTAREVQQDLEWTQKKVTQLNQRAAKKYAKQYAMAQERYPAPVEY